MRSVVSPTAGLSPRRISRLGCLALLWSLPLLASAQAAFDHSAWDALLREHVVVAEGGAASSVDYRSLSASRSTLDVYLLRASRLAREDFELWSLDDQLAFLINLYNAATVALILEHTPGIESIRDIGGLFSSAWNQERVALFGDRVTLDEIEHDMIRGWGRYEEPRIHFAVNCAAIGCPALRAEAYTGAALEMQLEDATRRFLGDRSRNRLEGRRLWVSSIFKWYREDFERGWGGSDSLEQFLARYASELGLDAEWRRLLEGGDVPIRFLRYDWGLNGLP